jgi:hypothetical protein
MATLHIEHAITDYGLWKATFDRFEEMRRQSGVKHHRVYRPTDDPAYIVVDLDFGTTEEAGTFLEFLHNNVWSSPQSAPALAGRPQTRILDLCEDR